MEACIRKWRCSSSSRDHDPDQLASTSKTCPLCRVRTRYIVPSVVWPQNQTQKANIERVYLLRLSKIPCRYFTNSLKPREFPADADGNTAPHPRREIGPWCPFGNDCHYLHEKLPGVEFKFSEAQVMRGMWGHRNARRRNAYERGFGARSLPEIFLIDGEDDVEDWGMSLLDNLQFFGDIFGDHIY